MQRVTCAADEMPHRMFRDDHGEVWDAWDVHPTAIERRLTPSVPGVLAPGQERRHRQESRVLVPRDLEQGWLAFESRREARRLAPVPDGWSEMSDDELVRLVRSAARVRSFD